MKLIPFLIFFICAFNVIGQSGSILYGNVTSEQSQEGLVGATVVLLTNDQQISNITGENGYYSFEEVLAGRYELEISFLGFQTKRLVEVLIEAGRYTEINIQLKSTSFDLPIAVVRPGQSDLSSQQLPGAQLLTIEETRRLPATFNDPARQLIAYPGIVNTNDQANNISVRGNSPVSLSWRIEGAEILNPNHLSNAGTQSDRTSEASGGVNILSAQMLSTSAFYPGTAPIEYGNLQGGLMDMRLRSGNKEKWEGTFQVGLLGFDASVEGPFVKNKSASYLFNYRYSTLGLLNALGVQLGDEKIIFQDIAVHLNFPVKKFGTFSFFGFTGASETELESKQDSTEWEFDRDVSNINFFSKSFFSGFNHKVSIFNKGIWKTTAVYSKSNNYHERISEQLALDHPAFFEANEYILQKKLSILSKLDYPINNKFALGLGVEDITHEIEINDNGTDLASRNLQLASGTVRTFANAKLTLSNSFNLNIGGTYQFDSRLNFRQHNFLPNFNMNYQFNNANQIRFAYSQNLRHQPYFQYFAPADSIPSNSNITTDISSNLLHFKSDNISLSHKIAFKKSSKLTTEIYFQKIRNAATYIENNENYSSLNFEEYNFSRSGLLENNGLGRNFGIEILWQKYFTKEYYFLLNSSLFKSQYKNGSADWRSTRYDAKYLFNITAGKEFRWKKKWDKTLGINIRLTYLGNLRRSPIDLNASIEQGREVLGNDLFSEQLRPYAKGDLRLYLRTDKKKYSNSLSLDIQNFFNRKNDGFYFYDRKTQSIQAKQQLGLIPILSWRLSI